MSSEILVSCQGRIVKEFAGNAAKEETLSCTLRFTETLPKDGRHR